MLYVHLPKQLLAFRAHPTLKKLSDIKEPSMALNIKPLCIFCDLK